MTIYLIILIGITGQLGYNGSKVAVSLYALELGASQFAIGVLVALYAVFPMLLAIYVGKFVDRVGPMLPVVLGIVGMGLALVLPPLFPGVSVLYVSCAVLGLAHLYFMIPLEASVGGIGGEERRAANYALLSMGWSIANFLGPVIAGLAIDYIGHAQVFWVLASCYVLPSLIVWFRPRLLPRTAAHARKGGRGSVLDLCRIPTLRSVLIAGAVVNAAQNLFQFYLPIYGHALGISASAIGTIIGLVASAAFLIRSAIPYLLKRRTETQILTYSLFVAAFTFALLPLVANAYLLAGIAFMFGLGAGCANPLSMSLLYVVTPQGRMAESVGLLRTAYNVTQLVVPVLFGSLGAAFGFSTVFLSNSALLAAGGWLMRKIRLTPDDRGPK